jgi:ribokinase
MTAVAITGYASLDYVVRLEHAPQRDATVIAGRTGDWPRLGGSPCYIAMALVRAGISHAIPVTWVADDEAGRRFVAALAAAYVPIDGVARSLPGGTPVCILAYAPDDACFCLYDPGASRNVGLDSAQCDILDAAGWVCLTAGPARATRQVLARLAARQHLCWAVKADADAFPPDLRAEIAARADLIVFNRREHSFVSMALDIAAQQPGRILVETRGAEGALLTVDGKSELIPAAPVAAAAADPTGAGDTFIGGMLASLITRSGDAAVAVRAGQEAARTMLLARANGLQGMMAQ